MGKVQPNGFFFLFGAETAGSVCLFARIYCDGGEAYEIPQYGKPVLHESGGVCRDRAAASGDGRIGGLLHKGLAYWYAKKPSSLNWWHGEIGVPKKLAAILLMIRGELSGPELEQGLRIIERSRFGRTGQNL